MCLVRQKLYPQFVKPYRQKNEVESQNFKFFVSMGLQISFVIFVVTLDSLVCREIRLLAKISLLEFLRSSQNMLFKRSDRFNVYFLLLYFSLESNTLGSKQRSVPFLIVRFRMKMSSASIS